MGVLEFAGKGGTSKTKGSKYGVKNKDRAELARFVMRRFCKGPRNTPSH